MGKKIINLKKEIENSYDILKRNKTNNAELIILYSNYAKIFDGNKDKYQIIKYNDIINKEMDYYNINANLFKEKDNIYSVISTDKGDLGTIMDCSHNFAKFFGYVKDEIIKQNINILIPEIFHNKHDQIVKKRFSEDKNELYKKIINEITSKINCIEKETYSKKKKEGLIMVS